MNKISNKTPVFIDFETYMNKSKRYTLDHLSDVQYITDPRFEVLSVAISVNNKISVYPGNTHLWPTRVAGLNNDDHFFIAHNGRFDFRILSLRFGITPLRMSDTMLMARFLGYPKCGLGNLAEQLLFDKKLELNTDGKRLKNLGQVEWLKLARYNAKDVELTQRLYQFFFSNFPQIEMLLIDQTLRLCLKPHSIDWDRVESLIVKAELNLNSFRIMNSELFDNRNRSVWIRNHIRICTGIDPKTVDKKKIVINELPTKAQKTLQDVWMIKEIEKERGSLDSFRRRMTSGTNTTALIDLNYSKAVTHRWSSGGEGSQSFNIQNMGRKSGIRNIWIPDKGNVYIIVDLSQIEARVAAWYAGEKELLRAFADGICIYCNFGQHVFGHVLNGETEKSERQLCKQAVLGLQFGMGTKRFLQTLVTQAPDHLEKATVRLNASSNYETASKVVVRFACMYSAFICTELLLL